MKKRLFFIILVILIGLFIIFYFTIFFGNQVRINYDESDKNYENAYKYLELGEYLKAYEFAMSSYLIEKQGKEGKRYAGALNLLGNIYEKTGLYIKALEMHYESLEIQKIHYNERGIANSYHNIAHLNMIAGRYDNAYNFYRKAQEIYENLQGDSLDLMENRKNLVKIYLSMGNYFITQKDSTQAFIYLKKALVLSKKDNDRLNIAQSFLYLGNCYFQCNDYLSAKDYYLKSLELNIEEKNRIGIIVNKINVGRIYYLSNRINESINALNYALDIAAQVNAGKQIAEASELLYSIYSGMPDSIEQTKKYAAVFLDSKKYLPNEAIQDSIIQKSIKYEVISKKNEEILIEKYKRKITIVLFIGLLIAFVIGAWLIYDRNRLKQQALYTKKMSNEKLLRYREVFSAIEQERKRIAVDLHDSLGQTLTATRLSFSGLEDLLRLQGENGRKKYKDTIDLLDMSSNELRNISFNIMPGTLIKFGLKSAVEEIIHRIKNNNEVEVNFKSIGFDEPAGEGPEIIIYRIIQEILNNILKHAHATIINIYLGKELNTVNLTIEDNGVGMEDFEKHKNKGLGWKSIFSRVEMLNGNIKIKTELDKGTKIDVIFTSNNL